MENTPKIFPSLIKPYLWIAHYFLKDGGVVRFAVVAKTSNDVVEMLTEEINPYRSRGIIEVKITLAEKDFYKIDEV